MKKLKVFLASSINEFKEERNEIGDFILRLNNELIEHDVKVNLIECEFFDNNISAEFKRKQEDYNNEIKNSDVFVMLVGERIGEFTEEEYEVARTVPNIHRNILFKNCASDESVSSLKSKVESDDTYYFENSKHLKANIGKIIVHNLQNELPISGNEESIVIGSAKVKI